MIRDMPYSDSNPYHHTHIENMIEENLKDFTFDVDYDIILVPNIVNIGYGRDVGYTIKQYDLGEEIHAISATKIRNELKNRTDDT